MSGRDLRRLPLEQLIRFSLVGAVNTAFSYGVYCLFLYLGLGYAVASFLALCAGILWSFVANGKLVFRQQLKGRFARYLVVWALLYGLNVALVGGLVALGCNAYLAGLIAMVPVVILAYCLQRWLVFAA